LFVIPCKSYFKTAFTFGERAANVILESKKIPKSIKNDLVNAKKYVEGKTIQIEVKNELDCKNILELIQIKLS